MVGWLVAERPSNMLVYLRDRSVQTVVCAATLRQNLTDFAQSRYTDTRLTSPSADPVTPGSWHGSPTRESIFESQVSHDLENDPRGKWN